ncbi:MAG: bifunctional 5,10-methylenetetrahydrofolate dehydrogenase/5,10-methenyltetrahydrofolate cyclohydrolase [Rickettsiales bacterium]|jgi:methylenetetrahydrofolate dehydrogenase (NADP+)/methenyltetrahydrofolate cyclohydrolase|nr:bifunctional 5,10-methylenetetrahydrofolate dehydrogenase/5,10-methenyltetrahydrofolate cyclohydrolase [Rickettsiales bacterium]
MILDGKSLAEQLAGELKARAVGRDIRLAVVLVGDDFASVKYVNAKQKRALEVGIKCDIIALSNDISEDELLKAIHGLNADAKVHGVMIQLPLPKHINQARVCRAIDAKKDVDGLNPAGEFMPATVRGIEKLLEHYLFGAGFDLDGKVAAVVGRSEIVGKPAAKMLLDHNATVIMCHSKTKDLASFTRRADILVAATGKDGMITPDFVKDGAIIIDAGTIGDVRKDCFAAASAYTPVPGGVGPMTVVCLIENTIKAAI